MNKIQVGHAPSPTFERPSLPKLDLLIMLVTTPGGGMLNRNKERILNKRQIEAKNDKYVPKGGEKK
ncbi:hypothetical protein DOY81_013446, partial [Sarcophaga bullata]